MPQDICHFLWGSHWVDTFFWMVSQWIILSLLVPFSRCDLTGHINVCCRALCMGEEPVIWWLLCQRSRNNHHGISFPGQMSKSILWSLKQRILGSNDDVIYVTYVSYFISHGPDCKQVTHSKYNSRRMFSASVSETIEVHAVIRSS